MIGLLGNDDNNSVRLAPLTPEQPPEVLQISMDFQGWVGKEEEEACVHRG